MNFELSLEQQMIRDTACDVLAACSDSAAVRRIIDAEPGGTDYDTALWHQLGRELGWCGLTLPENVGGAGLGAMEMVLVLEQLGRRLACVPYLSTVCLAAPVLQHCLGATTAEPWLARLAQGKVSAALAVSHDSPPHTRCGTLDERILPRILPITAQRNGDGFLLHGRVAQVFDAAHADWLLLAARLTEETTVEPALFLINRAAFVDDSRLKVNRLHTLDLTRPIASVECVALPVSADQCLARGNAVAHGVEVAMWTASLAVAAEQLGGAQQCLDLTVAYTSERVQFGRPIASFQAVKHRCAQMMVGIEALRSMVYGAAHALNGMTAGDASASAAKDIQLDIAAARAMATDIYAFCAQEAIQLHGGVGFTWEYDPQLHFKRARASAHWFGSTPATLDAMANALLDQA